MTTGGVLDLDTFARGEYSRVVTAVARITGDSQGAADAVQDVLVRLMARPPAVRPRNIAAWVTVAATNRSRDLRRTRFAEYRALQRLGPLDRARDPSSLDDFDLRAALARLPDQQRRACELFYVLDLSVESIAATLAVSEGTVKTHLHRARRTLALQYP